MNERGFISKYLRASSSCIGNVGVMRARLEKLNLHGEPYDIVELLCRALRHATSSCVQLRGKVTDDKVFSVHVKKCRQLTRVLANVSSMFNPVHFSELYWCVGVLNVRC